MYVTSVFSIKGGVGKTATAVNLAALASFSGAKTLLIDLDPQGSASFYLRVKPKIKTTVRKLIKGKTPVESLIKATDYVHLDILPSTMAYRETESELAQMKRPGDRIREMLQPLESTYRWVFIDCPPGLTLLAESIFRASQLVLVPVVPTTLSVRTYTDLMEHFRENPLTSGTIVNGFFSMTDRRKSMHRDILNEWDYAKEPFCRTIIPYLSDIEKMGTFRKPVVASKPGSESSDSFIRLWEEIQQRIS